MNRSRRTQKRVLFFTAGRTARPPSDEQGIERAKRMNALPAPDGESSFRFRNRWYPDAKETRPGLNESP